MTFDPALTGLWRFRSADPTTETATNRARSGDTARDSPSPVGWRGGSHSDAGDTVVGTGETARGSAFNAWFHAGSLTIVIASRSVGATRTQARQTVLALVGAPRLTGWLSVDDTQRPSSTGSGARHALQTTQPQERQW